jgi:putative (di)nucleoside polyphosphate hydrolase
MPLFRPNVAFILQNPAGEILICERSDALGCWQFPQGGIKREESPAQALSREVEEELGLLPSQYRILATKGPYRYLFTDGYKKKNYDGQEQHYFLAELTQADALIRLDHAGEFRATRWLPPEAYRLNWISPMKREVYIGVFRDFFGVELQPAVE